MTLLSFCFENNLSKQKSNPRRECKRRENQEGSLQKLSIIGSRRMKITTKLLDENSARIKGDLFKCRYHVLKDK